MISTFTENIQDTPVEQARRKLCHRNLLKLSNLCVRGGRRLSSKIPDSAIFLQIAKKLEKSQKLLKLINSSVNAGRRLSSKIWDEANCRNKNLGCN